MDFAIADIAGKAKLDITDKNVSSQMQALRPENSQAIENELKMLEQNYYAQIDRGLSQQNHDLMQDKMLQNNTLNRANASASDLKKLTDKTSVNRKKIVINDNNELLQVANNIKKSTKITTNGEILPPKAKIAESENKIFTCLESGNPIIKKCYKNRIVKVVKPADIRLVLEVYFSAQSYNGHSTTVDLKNGAINYDNATAINSASHVVNPLNQKLMGAKIVSIRHIESRWWDETQVHTGSVSHTITQMPSLENNYVYKNTIVQNGITGKSSRRRNSDKYRGRVEKWEITATPDAVLEDTWDEGQCPKITEFAAKNSCSGPVVKLLDLNKTRTIADYPYPITRPHWQEEHVYTCGVDNEINECDALHKAACTQVDSKCIKVKGNFCVQYLQTFECSQNQVTFSNQSHNITIALDKNTGAEDAFAVDDFGNAVAQLSLIEELKNNIIRPTDGTVLLFEGERLTCDKDFGADIKNCCNLKGIFKNIIGHKCPEEVEKKLAPAVVRERRCVEIKDWQCIAKTLGKCHKWQKSYCCYQSRLARIFQQIAHHQLGISWGTAAVPNCGPLDPHTFGKLNFNEPYAKELLKELIIEANTNSQKFSTNANAKLQSEQLSQKINDLQNRVSAYYTNKLNNTDGDK